MNNRPDVAILGGGLAGMSAALALSQQGYAVTIIEQKKHLGGRTYSYVDEQTGDEVDNGQHIMLGCYHETIRYLTMIDNLDAVSLQPILQIRFRERNALSSDLSAWNLPAPFHMVPALMKLSMLTLKERISALSVGVSLALPTLFPSASPDGISAEEYLTRLGQSHRVQQKLWNIIAIGALNGQPSEISGALFSKILGIIFFGDRKNASVMIPKYGLSAVFVEKAQRVLAQRRVEIILSTAAASCRLEKNHAVEIELENGRRLTPQAVISTIPHFMIDRFIKKSGMAEQIDTDFSGHFISSPIITINLWLDRECMSSQFEALIDSPLHWVFNKSAISPRTRSTGQYLSIVISSASALVQKSSKELVALALEELAHYFPAALHARVIHSKVIKERRATFLPAVGIEKKRPAARTPVRNFFLAGDWTDTGLPATIEGAITSGFHSAALVDEYFKNPKGKLL